MTELSIQLFSVETGSEPMIVVLLVEDEVLIRMTMADALIDAGYRVVEAGNAEEALTVLRARDDVRLLVTDVRMPGALDGFALARRVGAEWPGIGILIASGHAMLGDEAVPEGTLFLRKPFSDAELLHQVRALAATGAVVPTIAPDEAVLVPDASAAAEALTDGVADAGLTLEKDSEA